MVPFIEFVCIPADSLHLPHQSAKCRVRLASVDTAARVITMIMLADGADMLPNVVNIVVEWHRCQANVTFYRIDTKLQASMMNYWN